jgi:hypothetical protein
MPKLGLVGNAGIVGAADALQEIVAQRYANAAARDKLLYDRGQDAFKNELEQRRVAATEGQLSLSRENAESDAVPVETIDPVSGRRSVRYVRKREIGGQEFQKPREILNLTNVLGPDGKPGIRRIDQDTGQEIDFTPTYRAPSYMTLRGIADGRGGSQQRVFDPETGQIIYQGSEFHPATAAGAGKPPTGEQLKTVGFYDRMKNAIDTLDTVEEALSPTDVWIIQSQPFWGMANNMALSNAGQMYANALMEFTEARLRKESGATAPDPEYARDRMLFGRQVGDQADVVNRRKLGRQRTAEGFAFQSGPAYEQFYGRPFEPTLARGGGGNQGGNQGAGGATLPKTVTEAQLQDAMKAKGWTRSQALGILQRNGITLAGQ